MWLHYNRETYSVLHCLFQQDAVTEKSMAMPTYVATPPATNGVGGGTTQTGKKKKKVNRDTLHSCNAC